MALTPITEGATSAATDLNQVVNLLNGTTTNTQVTVNGPISAQLTGTTAPMRYVGGVPGPLYPSGSVFSDNVFKPSNPVQRYVPLAIPTHSTDSGAALYGNADLAWAPGGPLVIGAAAAYTTASVTAVSDAPAPPRLGMGGYAARVHQAGAVAINTIGSPMVSGDTIDFDPRGMVQSFGDAGGNGITIALPFLGLWGFAAAIHGSGVNSMSTGWSLAVGGFAFPASTPSYPSDSTHKYTGVSWSGYAMAGGPYGDSNEVYFITPSLAPAPSSFNLDVSGPDRTYIAVWLVA